MSDVDRMTASKPSELENENERLRAILSQCATVVGANVAPNCSVEFLRGIPKEIGLALRSERALTG